MPTSPSLAARRASSSSCKSFFLISTVPLSAARPLEAGGRLAALLLRVWVSRAATVAPLLRGMGPPVDRWATRLPAMPRHFDLGGGNLTCAWENRPEFRGPGRGL